jgi:hypothetical protein
MASWMRRCAGERRVRQSSHRVRRAPPLGRHILRARMDPLRVGALRAALTACRPRAVPLLARASRALPLAAVFITAAPHPPATPSDTKVEPPAGEPKKTDPHTVELSELTVRARARRGSSPHGRGRVRGATHRATRGSEPSLKSNTAKSA